MAASFDYLIGRNDLSRHQCVAGVVNDGTPLLPGQAVLSVDEFAFTSNNVTYAKLGDALNYWKFFPTDGGWGRIPVCGMGTVLHSECAGIAPGNRYFGYFPMSTHVLLQPVKLSASGFSDGAAHRADLHAVYNQYLSTDTDPFYDRAHEAQMLLLRPLFVLSFLVDDFLADNDFFGARSVVLSSASSKTAYGIAFLLARRHKVRVIGLTSRSNLTFVERLGCYDTALAYEQIERLRDDATVYVDLAGSKELRRAVHWHCNDRLKYSCAVGLTHGDELVGAARHDEALTGPQPEFFFAPRQIKKRSGDWGPAELQRRMVDAWREFLLPVAQSREPWVRVVRARGPAAVTRVVDDMVCGRVRPQEGHVLTLIEH